MRPAEFPFPPRKLADRIGVGVTDDRGGDYQASGAGMRELIVDCLPEGWGFEGRRILDFGCGAGRVMRQFADEARVGEVWGCDIDQTSIDWIEANLSPPFRAFRVTEKAGLPVADGFFDLIYAISVFTHITDEWSAWLLELHRALKPDGLFMASYLGEGMIGKLTGGEWEPDRVGMNVLRHGESWEIGGPIVFHSEWWLRAHWGRAFEVLRLWPSTAADGTPIAGHHGWVLLRKRPVALTLEDLERLEDDEPRELDAICHNVEQLHGEDHHLRAHVRGLHKRLDETEEALAAAEVSNTHLRDQIRATQASKSWRIAIAMRRIAQALRLRGRPN